MQALGSHPAPDRLAKAYAAPRGIKLHFEESLSSPDRANPTVRTVWQTDAGTDGRVARFVTLKPLKRRVAP